MSSRPTQTDTEPISKKRKLGLSTPTASQEKQNGSFTEILEKLKDEAKETGGKAHIFMPWIVASE